MVAKRTAVHVWLHPILAAALVVALGACETEDPDEVGTTDGAVQPGAGFDAGAIAGGAALGGGTMGGFPGGGTTGGGITGGLRGATTGGGTTGGSPGATTGGGTTGGFFGGGFPGARLDAGGPDAGPAVDAGAPVSGDGGPDQFAELRQVCVDTINMHRATLGLAPLARANAMQESCSDLGAQKDGTGGGAHSSAQGNTTPACRAAGLGAQNACPGWPSRPSLADSLKRCLAQMWAEGEPPIPVEQCKRDQSERGCFQTYGHWINMTAAVAAVSCGFYDMGNNMYWMNQDFVGTAR
jgi:hypothetical protein